MSNRGYAAPKGRAGNPPAELTKVKGGTFMKTFEITREIEYRVEAENEAEALGVVLDVELLGRVRETPLPRIQPLTTRVVRVNY